MPTSEIIAIVLGLFGLFVASFATIKAYNHAKKDAENKINKHKSLLDGDKQGTSQKTLVSH